MSGGESLATDIVSALWWDGGGQTRVDHRKEMFKKKRCGTNGI